MNTLYIIVDFIKRGSKYKERNAIMSFLLEKQKVLGQWKMSTTTASAIFLFFFSWISEGGYFVSWSRDVAISYGLKIVIGTVITVLLDWPKYLIAGSVYCIYLFIFPARFVIRCEIKTAATCYPTNSRETIQISLITSRTCTCQNISFFLITCCNCKMYLYVVVFIIVCA